MSDGYLSKDREHLARLQRVRRARMRRMDYMPSPEALAVIESQRAQHRPGSQAATNSAVIDAIVKEWAALTGIKYARIEKPMTPELLQPLRARAGAYDSGSKAKVNGAFRAGAYDFGQPESNAKQARRVVCGATRHRDGQPCNALSEPGKRRCRFHGGRSTGPRTDAGKARALANLRQNRRG